MSNLKESESFLEKRNTKKMLETTEARYLSMRMINFDDFGWGHTI